jgi:hypothetical protein
MRRGPIINGIRSFIPANSHSTVASLIVVIRPPEVRTVSQMVITTVAVQLSREVDIRLELWTFGIPRVNGNLCVSEKRERGGLMTVSDT